MENRLDDRIKAIRDEMARGVNLGYIARDIGINYQVLWRMVARGYTPSLHYKEMIDRWIEKRKATAAAV